MLFLYKIINTLTIVRLDFFKIIENKSRKRLPRITLKDNTVRMNLFHIPNFSFGQQKRDPMPCGQLNQLHMNCTKDQQNKIRLVAKRGKRTNIRSRL
jgi:hypothetical protein